MFWDGSEMQPTLIDRKPSEYSTIEKQSETEYSSENRWLPTLKGSFSAAVSQMDFFNSVWFFPYSLIRTFKFPTDNSRVRSRWVQPGKPSLLDDSRPAKARKLYNTHLPPTRELRFEWLHVGCLTSWNLPMTQRWLHNNIMLQLKRKFVKTKIFRELSTRSFLLIF